MHPTLTAALDVLRAGFGAADRAEVMAAAPGAGWALPQALVSHGFARERDDRLTLTDAGWRAAKAQEAPEAAE